MEEIEKTLAGLDLSETKTLLQNLRAAPAKLVKPRFTQVGIYEVTSWKCWEYAYNKDPCPLPTLARGLFTVGDRIVIRGYDKFFNTGEVKKTDWSNIINHTTGPYRLTYKENGCIIFIGALSEDELLVTSKHAVDVGEDDVNTSHARVGKKWLERHLNSVKKTTEDLVLHLWTHKLTAVAELCDDEFEEHVLAYTKEKTGLHLHGLNHNSAAFQTEPFEKVAQFAREYGFIETRSFEMDSIQEIRDLAATVEQDGQYKGEAIEGFVVRTRYDDTDFFFKLKFNEPYLMYREWREMTKVALNHGARRATYPESVLYQEWMEGDIKRNASLYERYNRNQGIVSNRERFLALLKSEDYQKKLEHIKTTWKTPIRFQKHQAPDGNKILIIPVGIPGCGKTTLFIALQHLLKAQHIQNDNIKEKKTAPVFLRQIKTAFKSKNLVIADKNNHTVKLRQAMIELAQEIPSRIICINFDITSKSTFKVHDICCDRVSRRGQNHQTLRQRDDGGHEAVVAMFLRQFEPLLDGERDKMHVIDLDITASPEQTLVMCLQQLCPVIKQEIPSKDALNQALQLTETYQPDLIQDLKTKYAPMEPRYFCILLECDVQAFLISQNISIPFTSKQIVPQPHATIVHSNSKSLPGSSDIWSFCAANYVSLAGQEWVLTLKALIWDDDIAACVVDKLETDSSDLNSLLRKQELPLHVTLCYREGVNPVTANELIVQYKAKQNVNCLNINWTISGRFKAIFFSKPITV